MRLFLTIVVSGITGLSGSILDPAGTDKGNFTVYINNSVSSPPALLTVDQFWQLADQLDKFDIKSENFKNLLLQEVKELKKEDINYEFSIAAAILIPGNGRVDTLYADKFYRSWKKENENYKSTSTGLYTMFAGMMFYRYEK